MNTIELTQNSISVEALVAWVTHPDAGGISVFLGTTRNERHSGGRDLLALDYEAYEAMARKRLEQLAEQARASWPIAKLAIHHRLGRVPLGEASVVIAVSSPHRAEAFDACRYLIDSLKVDVPIWKKEIWSDGSASWVHPDKSSL